MSNVKSKRIVFDSKLMADKEYWTQKLSREIGESNLISDFERPADVRATKASIEFSLAEELAQKLARVTANSELLLYTFLHAVLKICLHKYTGSESIVLGSPSSRKADGGDMTAGALAIVDEIDGRESFKHFLLKVRETLKEAYSHEDYPFGRVVSDLALEQPANRCPLFDVSLGLKNIHLDMPEVGTDVTVTFAKSPDGITGRVEYKSELFKRTTIERFIQHFLILLGAVLEDVDAPIITLEMLTDLERQTLLLEWNDTRTDFPGAQSVHQLFEAQVAKSPDSIGLSCEDEHLTYCEINRRANRLAHYLRGLGVGPESLVAIYMERSVEMIVAVLGVLKSGGAYLPLDPGHPENRLAYMLEDAKAQVLLTEQRLVGGLPQAGARVVCLDAEYGVIAGHSGENLTSEVCAENLAYVIYTSGSTGEPKGVMVEHRGVSNLAEAQIRAFHISPGSRVLQFASLCFDASVSEIFTTLTIGATLDLGSRDTLFSGPALVRVMRDQAITTLTLPPSILALIDSDEASALQTVVAAGEACSYSIVARWSRGRNFINAYGPTETTVCASLLESDKAYAGSPPIGRPIANTHIYLLDRFLKPVPIGVRGELCIGGAGLTRGYLNRPDLTAEKFMPNPFDSQPGARLYKAGDLAYYLPDGNIAFLGRIDHQVKIRGYRIELGEIEAALSEHPSVRDVVVVARDDISGDRRMVAYVVSGEEPAPTVAELRNYLRQRLPDYMVPSLFVTLTAMPLTASGKVDRHKLPAPGQTRPELAEEFVPPRTPQEQELAGIFSQVLNIEKVSAYDNFFELGGHSLLAIQVVSRVRDIFHVEIPVRSVFEAPTVAELAVAIVQSQAEMVDSDEMPDLLAEIEQLSEDVAAAIAADENQL